MKLPIEKLTKRLDDLRRRASSHKPALEDGDPGRNAARSGLLAFTTHTMPGYEVNWHHRLICGQMDRLVRGEVTRLMLFTPPRHGKSEIASRRLPAYLLGRDPDLSVISCSYSADLAGRMNRDVQRVMESRPYGDLFPASRLNEKNVRSVAGGWLRNSQIFEVVGRKGSYRSAGVGGGITGMGFDVGVIDDPVKNREEADSPTVREKVWEWYSSTFWTRQAPGARILLIMTRWHPDDLAGRLLRQMKEDPDADRWEVVTLPALRGGLAATPGDDRAEGEPLWPQRYGEGFLRTAKSALGSAGFAALYQQDPVDEGGNHFKEEWFRGRFTRTAVPDLGEVFRLVKNDGSVHVVEVAACRRFVIVDPAASEKESADYTAIGVFAVTPANDLLVLHVVRERLGVDRIVPAVRDVCREWRPSWVGMEASGFQVSLVNAARRVAGMPPVRELSHDGKGKLVRATPAVIKAEAGQIVLPDGAAWVGPWVEEHVRFKGLDDDHDDQVDVTAYAVIGMGLSADVPTLVRK